MPKNKTPRTPHPATSHAGTSHAGTSHAGTSHAAASHPSTTHQERFTDNRSGKFTRCNSADTRNLLVGKDSMGLYLQHKIGQIKGMRPDEVLHGTPISIPHRYANSEGIIQEMVHQKGFVKGLRIDLQKAQVIGGRTYATFQIQWGTGQDGKNGGAYAGALMEVDKVFNAGDLRTALTNSFESLTYWRIDG